MKVYLGPYIKWIGPYHFSKKLYFLINKIPGINLNSRWIFDFADYLEKDKKGNDSLLFKICNWVYEHRKRKIKVRIDKYDTLEMDKTLALIILPMLKQIKKNKQGSPFIDDEDVPEELRSINASTKKNKLDIDDNFHKRWEWILDEMIWAFEQLQPNNNWEEQYISGNVDIRRIPCEIDENGNPKCYRTEKGPNHTFKLDTEGLKKHEERIRRGTTLFGKYFQHISD